MRDSSVAVGGNLKFGRLSSVGLVRGLLAVAVAAMVVAPPFGAAGAQEGDPATERQQVSQGAELTMRIDALKAADTAVAGALTDLEANVDAQREAVAVADKALSDAQAALAAADKAVKETQARLDDVTTKADVVVVEAFVNPPAGEALDALSSDSLSDAIVKHSILDRRATENARTLETYAALEDQLEEEEATHEAAAEDAKAKQADAEAALADLKAAQTQQAAFVAEVLERLDKQLAEAEMLKTLDPAAAAEVKARAAALAAEVAKIQIDAQQQKAQEEAARASAIAAANQASGIRQPPGGITTATCPTGGTITVAGQIQSAVQHLLDAAAAQGFNSMCGNGYRDPNDQVALRRANCGSSYYALYQAPSSYCSPPTARPGASMHEQGLAVDFTCGGGTVAYGTACYSFLKANAAAWGLFNLAGEPWHWSTDGT